MPCRIISHRCSCHRRVIISFFGKYQISIYIYVPIHYMLIAAYRCQLVRHSFFIYKKYFIKHDFLLRLPTFMLQTMYKNILAPRLIVSAFFFQRSSTYCMLYLRGGFTYNPDGAYKQKTVIAMTKFTSKPLLMGPPPRALHFLPCSYHHRSALAKSAAALFFALPS